MAQPRSGKPGLPGGTSGSMKNNVTPLTKKTGDNMVIPPWSKQGVPGGQGRTSMRTASALRRAVDEESSSSGRNLGVLLALLLVGSVVAARQYCMLDGTPLGFLNPDTCGRPMALAPRDNGKDTGGRIPSSNTDIQQPQQVAPPVTQGQGVIMLQTIATEYQVFVNGQQVGVQNNSFEAPLNQDLNIDVVRFGYQSAHFKTRLLSPAPAAFRVDLAPLPAGTIYFATTPVVKASFYQAGKLIFEANTPIRDKLVPAGHYRVVMENSLLNLHSETEIDVEDGKLLRVEKVLKQ